MHLKVNSRGSHEAPADLHRGTLNPPFRCTNSEVLALPQLPLMKNLTFVPICDVISDVQIQFRSIFEKFKPGAIKCHFGIENRSSSLADSRGGGGEVPPSIGGQGLGICSQGVR